MQYRKRSQFNQKKLIIGAILFGVAIVFSIGIHYVAFSKPVYPDVSRTMILSRANLQKQITALQTTVESYKASQSQLTVLQTENDQLKAELGRPDHMQGTLATVLFTPGRSLYDTFIIDAGSADNIKVGQTAYAFGSVALGTVSAVRDHDATVLLVSNPNRETSGTVTGDNVAITLIGRGAGEYEVHMPREVKFQIGEPIQLQSTKPYVLAEIKDIETDPRDPFQRLLAKVPVNLQNLKWVIVE